VINQSPLLLKFHKRWGIADSGMTSRKRSRRQSLVRFFG